MSVQTKFRVSKIRGRRSKFIIVAVLILIIVVSVACYLSIKNTENTSKTGDVSASKSSTITRSEEILNKDGAVAAQTYLDSEIDKTNDKSKKAEMYLQKSTIASSLGGGDNTDTALDYAINAEELDANFQSALMTAVLYEKQNDIPNAIRYYKLYLERYSKIKDTLPDNENDYDYYAQRVQDLEAGKL